MKNKVIHLHPKDNVAIALEQLIAGTVLINGVSSRGLIPAGHKVALSAVAKGETIYRYGQPIGLATQDIEVGSHVHTHNLSINNFQKDYAFAQDYIAVEKCTTPRTFKGIVRSDGRVATRNYIGVLTSVNCSATVAKAMADAFRKDIHPDMLANYPNVDGVVALTHGEGCAIDSKGDGLKLLRRTLAGYAKHPNFAAVLVVGLGCETNQIAELVKQEGLSEGALLHTFTIQDSGGTVQTIKKGIEIIKELLPQANRVTRTDVGVEHLVVGLQCGGSDGYSGITANPVLGAAVDILVKNGGTAILSETPEIFGAEHLLTRRAVNQEVGQKLVSRIEWWQALCEKNGASLDNNPSSGNKAGGLTTVLEKSLGGIAKSGSTGLMDVYEYAEPVRTKGLVFMDTPGYDPVSATGQVAGGANLICFTTGRGSAYGCAPSPSLKLATNTALWNRQQDDMDFNCGAVAEGSASIQELGEQFFELMLLCASGHQSKSEQHGYGQNEFVPWQISVIT